MRIWLGYGLPFVAGTLLAACGGGGGGARPAPPETSSSTPSATPAPTPTPTHVPQTYPVAGTVVQIPVDAYGPATIDGVTYQSADADQTTPLAGAAVIIGPVPIVGATVPPTLPTGDVAATTNANGAFTITLTVAPAAPSSAEPFVIPPQNLSGTIPPSTGYYVQVFGVGTDGVSAGMLLPLHRFLVASTSLSLRVTTASPAEATALANVNSDRASNAGAGPLIFDEEEEEVARLHASDEATNNYTCHYDLRNVGPSSRYLAVGGIGLTAENIESGGIDGSASAAFAQAEGAFLSEKSSTGPHYLNLVDATHNWLGLAALPMSSLSGYWEVDYDFGTSDDLGAAAAASGYTSALCPAGIVVNDS